MIVKYDMITEKLKLLLWMCICALSSMKNHSLVSVLFPLQCFRLGGESSKKQGYPGLQCFTHLVNAHLFHKPEWLLDMHEKLTNFHVSK